MFSNAARFLMVSAAASLVSFGSASAEACADIADEAEAIVSIFEDDTQTPPPMGIGASFVTSVIRGALGLTGTDIALMWGSTSPNSALYYQNITQGNDFTQITNIGDIQRGDILSIGANGSYTGHTVIVLDAPEELENQLNPKWADTVQWALHIADSTTSRHGCSTTYPDSRNEGPCTGGTFEQGPGTAYMRLYTDLAGGLIGHTWSVSSVNQNQYYSNSTQPGGRPFAVGRTTFCSM